MRQTYNGWSLFKVKNKDIWTISEICSKLIITMKKYVEFIQIQQQENHINGTSCHFVILATLTQFFHSLSQLHHMGKICLVYFKKFSAA